ncbi:hypothetical protein BJ322DRAFT_1193090 [Thelephora terrestris]|uniref:Uncharacterized protein n=1 Tax=Thelephora terrestris TaxID=56493 RepID=A0A9P6HDY1_9AGAM|nr:hypothetical protein BJ322DRAFT_1193090 [Thelephora terrestris]
MLRAKPNYGQEAPFLAYINPSKLRDPFLTPFHPLPPTTMNTSTKPQHASVYNIPERPRVPPVPDVPPLRHLYAQTTSVSEEDCLTGYGEISVSECYDVVDVGGDEQKQRVPRLKHTRPRSYHQTQATRTVSNLVSTPDPNGRGQSQLTNGVGKFEPKYFRHIIKATSTDPPVNPEADYRSLFETMKNPPKIRRRRTLILQNAPASEAIDARPRPS